MTKKVKETAERNARESSPPRRPIPPTVEGELDMGAKPARLARGGVNPYGPVNERRRAAYAWVSSLKSPD